MTTRDDLRKALDEIEVTPERVEMFRAKMLGSGFSFATVDAIALAVNLAPDLLASEAALRAERNAAVARLPDGMKHCTIQFHECALGHGWLTATNWVQHGCPTCEADALRASLAAVTARAEKAEELLSRTCGPQALEDLRAQCKKAEAERDHLQARCEAEGAARKRLTQALCDVDTALSVPAAEYVPAIGDAFKIIRAALETKP